MKIFIHELVGALVMAMITALVFLLVGAYLSNFAEDFVFLGKRGYEAWGILGAMFGLLTGGILGALLAWGVRHPRQRRWLDEWGRPKGDRPAS